jgi:putative cell wall-binding protein
MKITNRKIFEKRPKFSISILITFIVVFLIAGGYIVYQMFGATNFDQMKDTIYTPTGKTAERIWGNSRYSTATGISKRHFPTRTGGTVILTSGENWPDATSGSVLASAYNGPLLLTGASSLHNETKIEINRIKPVRVVVLGGTTAVSNTVVNQVKTIVPNATVQRIAGSNRYDSAAKVADRIYALNGSRINDNTAIVVTGGNFPDAITVGSVAAAKRYPILYVSTTLPAETKSALTRLGIKRTLVVGGTTAIPDSVKNQLPGAIRISGSNRYATSVNFANYALNNISGLSTKSVGVATGEAYPDALAAASFVASRPGIIVLSPYNIGTVTNNFISGRKASIDTIYVFGGTVAVSNSTFMTLANHIGSKFSDRQIMAQNKVDAYIARCPILAGSVVSYGSLEDTQGNGQAIVYFKSGRIIVYEKHTQTIDKILEHEIYHIYDWRDNGVMNWGEKLPPSPKPACMP